MNDKLDFDVWYTQYAAICNEHDWPVPEQACMLDAWNDDMAPEDAFAEDLDAGRRDL